MRRKCYMLDTNVCAFWLRDKYGVKDFQNIKGIQIENWIERDYQQ